MNLGEIEERLWRFLGLHEAGQRPDWKRQDVRDAVNQTVDELSLATSSASRLIREGALILVPGVQDYALSDWSRRVLSFWTDGDANTLAHRLQLLTSKRADSEGWRDGRAYAWQGQLGPWSLTSLPKTAASYVSLTGPETVAEAATTLTWPEAEFETPALLVGRMLRLNGESADYEITAATDRVLTLDRPIRARMSSNTFNAVGAGYASPRVDIGPPGRSQVRFLPVPQAASVVRYRYVTMPRRLIHVSDMPEVEDDCAQVIWKGALKFLSTENPERYVVFINEYERAKADMVARDADTDIASDDPPELLSGLPSEYGYGRRREGMRGAPGGAVWQ